MGVGGYGRPNPSPLPKQSFMATPLCFLDVLRLEKSTSIGTKLRLDSVPLAGVFSPRLAMKDGLVVSQSSAGWRSIWSVVCKTARTLPTVPVCPLCPYAALSRSARSVGPTAPYAALSPTCRPQPGLPPSAGLPGLSGPLPRMPPSAPHAVLSPVCRPQPHMPSSARSAALSRSARSVGPALRRRRSDLSCHLRGGR